MVIFFCIIKFYSTKIEMDVWFLQDNLNFQARCLDTFDELLTTKDINLIASCWEELCHELYMVIWFYEYQK